MNIKSMTVAVTDKLKCDTCSHVLVCKMYEKLSVRSITTMVDDDDYDVILTSMCCKYHSNPFALHIKSTPEDAERLKKLLNEGVGTGIEYVQNQPTCVVSSTDGEHTCAECANVDKFCYTCHEQSNFVKRS